MSYKVKTSCVCVCVHACVRVCGDGVILWLHCMYMYVCLSVSACVLCVLYAFLICSCCCCNMCACVHLRVFVFGCIHKLYMYLPASVRSCLGNKKSIKQVWKRPMTCKSHKHMNSSKMNYIYSLHCMHSVHFRWSLLGVYEWGSKEVPLPLPVFQPVAPPP